MEIRRIREPELPAAMDLCWRVFQEFEAPDYPPKGVEAFYTYISNTEQVKYLTVFGAWERHQLLGVLAAEGDHIALFFRKVAYSTNAYSEAAPSRRCSCMALSCSTVVSPAAISASPHSRTPQWTG